MDGTDLSTLGYPVGNSMHGWEFIPSVDITVRDLGLLDVDQDGFVLNHRIGIWRIRAAALMVDATVSAGADDPLDGNYRFVSVSPTVLQAGVHYTIAFETTQGSTDPMVTDAHGSESFHPDIAWVGNRWSTGGGSSMPPNSTSADRYGPNFRFSRGNCNVADFETTSGDNMPVPNWTGGVANWNDWVHCGFDQFPYTAKSPPQRVYVPGGGTGRITFDRPVKVEGAYFAGPDRDPIFFRLYRNGSLVHTSGSIDLDGSGVPTWLGTGYAGAVDEVVVVGTYGFFVMDNLTYCETCPVVTFDNLSGSGSVPNGTGGIADWGNYQYYDSDQPPYNPKSGRERVYVPGNQSTRFKFGRDVRFEGAWFNGTDMQDVSFRMYRNGALVATSSTLSLNGDGLIRYLGSGYEFRVDEVEVTNTSQRWIMDNVTYCEVDGFDLTLTGACPGRVTIAWRGAVRNGTVALVYARNLRIFRIPYGPCVNTYLGLGNNGIRLVNTFPSGATGSGSRSGNTSACGDYLQMHDIPDCKTSNYVQIPRDRRSPRRL